MNEADTQMGHDHIDSNSDQFKVDTPADPQLDGEQEKIFEQIQVDLKQLFDTQSEHVAVRVDKVDQLEAEQSKLIEAVNEKTKEIEDLGKKIQSGVESLTAEKMELEKETQKLTKLRNSLGALMVARESHALALQRINRRLEGMEQAWLEADAKNRKLKELLNPKPNNTFGAPPRGQSNGNSIQEGLISNGLFGSRSVHRAETSGSPTPEDRTHFVFGYH